MKTNLSSKKYVCACCHNKTEENFVVDFERFFTKKIVLCKDCTKKLYEDIGTKFVPKSPKNIYKKPKIKE